VERLTLSEVRSSHSFTYLAATHIILVVGALVLALFWQIAGGLVLAAPSMLILLSAALDARLERPAVGVSVEQPRALEGDSVGVTVRVVSRPGVALADVEMLPHKKLESAGPLRAMSSIEPGGAFEAEFHVVVEEWGVVELGHVVVRARDRFGLSAITTRYRIVSTLRVHIHEESGRSLIEPDRFRRLVGSHRSQERGDGCEIADIRPYQPGDRLQSLNWRISARNDEPWITLRHPDRSTTIVLLLDAYQPFGSQRTDALRRSIRAVLGMGRLHLSAQDPVGMMIVGQGVRWIPPELGRLHLHRLTDAVLELSTNKWAQRRERRSSVARLIPKDAIVIAVSPLMDTRFSSVLTMLRGRGQSVHVIEPVTYWPNFVVPRRDGGHIAVPRNSWRLYSLQRQIERKKLSSTGIPVIPWEEDQPIESVLLALRMSQRARSAGAVR